MLSIIDLSISFTQYRTGLRQKTMAAVSNLNLSVAAGEILALVGSSGSGKSLLAHAILGILPSNATMTGALVFKGEPLTPERQRALRGRDMALIPQTVNSLDPLMRAGAQVRTSVRNGKGRAVQKNMFERFGLTSRDARRYPFQLSGGMARRVLVSSALASGARLIIADEPTPGLHHQVAQETLTQLRELADQGCAVMLITHDMGTALGVADQIAVLYAGTVVEICPSSDFKDQGHLLRHPYSRALWRALPENEFHPISGSQPLQDYLPSGCLFEPRCEAGTSLCKNERPELRELRSGKVRCVHAS
ncbi:MAG: ABC transporter ATP-binding protein [Proteobacteria bacterium]|nr:ABC transporter ATP-binding protein [Pseudomonadota bacterium]